MDVLVMPSRYENYSNAMLEGLARSAVVMHCLNPDRIVIHRGRREACAGALADIYEAIGGKVIWYGKPYAAMYDHARSLAGNPAKDEMLAIGDGLPTDILGAAKYGIDAIYVSHGIHAGEPVQRERRHRVERGIGAEHAGVPRTLGEHEP